MKMIEGVKCQYSYHISTCSFHWTECKRGSMGFSTLVTVKRGTAGTVISQHNPLRFDNISPQVAAQMQGASPYNTYEVYSLQGVPDIRTSDQLMDEKEIDPKTGMNTLYRVMGNVQVFDQSYLATLAEKLVGKVPA